MPKMKDTNLKQEPVLLEERYLGKLKEVKEYVKEYKSGPTEKLAWIFEIECSEDQLDPEVEYETEFNGIVEVACHTSLATGERSGFNQKGFWKVVGDDWDYDTDGLIGIEVLLDLEVYEDEKAGLTRNSVEKVKPKPKRKGGKGSTKADDEAEAQKLNEEDFADIPL